MCTTRNEVVGSGGNISGRAAARCFVMSIYVFRDLYCGSIYCYIVTPVLLDILHTASVSIDTNRMGLVGPQITCTHTLLTFLHAMKFKWVPPSFAMGLYPF